MEACTEEEVPKGVLETLGSQLTDEVLERLVAYAEHKARRCRWQGIYGAPMPEGLEPKDLVQQAVEKVLDGRRRWDPVRAPNLFAYLADVIDSDISHATTSIANRKVRDECALMDADGADGPHDSYLDRLPGGEDPEALMVTKEEEARSDRFLWGLLDSLADEPLLQRMIESIVDGVSEPRDMADRLGVTRKDIYNATKRLRRWVEAYRTQLLAQETR